MIIYYNTKLNFHNDPIKNLKLEKYKNMIDDTHVLIIGLGDNWTTNKYPFDMHKDPNIINFINNKKKLYYIDFEEDTGFYEPYVNRNYKLCEFEKIATNIFSIGPYVCEYLNKINNNTKRVNVPFFISEDYIKNIDYNKKNKDVIYTGNYGKINFQFKDYLPIHTIFETIKNFNYIWIGGDVANTLAPSYVDKLNFYSTSKIAVIHNVCLEVDTTSKKFQKMSKFEHFKYTEKTKLVPQFKSRTTEAALNKCIMLCYEDDYKVIEKYYKPNVDFLYWKTKNELFNLIDKILKNYNSYTYLAENAFQTTLKKCTTEAVMKNIIIPTMKNN